MTYDLKVTKQLIEIHICITITLATQKELTSNLKDAFSEWTHQAVIVFILASTLYHGAVTCAGTVWQIPSVAKIKPVVCEGVTSRRRQEVTTYPRCVSPGASKRVYTRSDRWYSRGVTGDFILYRNNTSSAWTIETVVIDVKEENCSDEIDRLRVILIL